MSPSLNRFLSNMKSRPVILIPIVLLAIAVSTFWIASKPSKEKLIKKLNSQLREDKFEQLYEEASDNLHLNVTKEQFVQRMKKAVLKLKAIDKNLNLQRDIETEKMMKITGDDESILITAFQKLEMDGKSVLVAFYWTPKGNFSDIQVFPNPGTSEEYRVYGVSYQHLYIGNQIVE
jgi:hypothetical protein